MKKLIKVDLPENSFEGLLEGTLENVITKIKDFNNELYKKYSEFDFFELKIEYYGYDGGWDFKIVGNRKETEEEYNERTEKELLQIAKKKQKEKIKEDKEKALLKKLKEKYES